MARQVEHRSEEKGDSWAQQLRPSPQGKSATVIDAPLQSSLFQSTIHDPQSTILFAGALAGEAKEAAFREADLFILPSHTENFGMAIAEALSHGLPVITTHGAPWKLLEEKRCGWWVPVSVDGIATALDDATRRSPDELAAMGERGRAVVAERFSWDKIAAEMVACYEWVLGRGAVPDCVR